MGSGPHTLPKCSGSTPRPGTETFLTSSFLSRELDAVARAMVNASIEVKAAMTKAVLAALSGFNDLMNDMEVKMKTLLQDKVQVGTFIKYILYIFTVNSKSLVLVVLALRFALAPVAFAVITELLWFQFYPAHLVK